MPALKPRTVFVSLAGGLASLIFFLAISGIGRADEPSPPQAVDRVVDGMSVDGWRARSRELGALAHARLLRLRVLNRSMRYRGTIAEAIDLACTIYGNCSTLWRKARCESANFTAFYNAGSHATGLFQFLPSTWRTTPFRAEPISSPYANALAAGWMHLRGRGGEWQCR